MCGVEKDEKSRGCLKTYLDVIEIFELCSKHYPSLVIGFLTFKKKKCKIWTLDDAIICQSTI